MLRNMRNVRCVPAVASVNLWHLEQSTYRRSNSISR